MKTVVFTNGDGQDWEIYAVLQVPNEMSREVMQSLYPIFMAEYDPDTGKIFAGSHNTDYIWQQNLMLHRLEYKGGDKTELFISWLCKHHGCVNVPFEEWY